MPLRKYARMFAALCMICALGFGLYMNFSEGAPKTLVSKAIMVCVYK